ncbi:MAG TPA: hypothetical protein VIO61_06795 [Anaerolineaceae bacterium]
MEHIPFWQALDALIAGAKIVIDRPAGTQHPRYPDSIYPYDYGYLAGTIASDGGGIDVWVGSLPDRRLTGILCTIDRFKQDTEIKLLLGCTPAEADIICRVQNSGAMSALLILRQE